MFYSVSKEFSQNRETLWCPFIFSIVYREKFCSFISPTPMPLRNRMLSSAPHTLQVLQSSYNICTYTQLIQRRKITSHSTFWTTVIAEEIYAELLYVAWNPNIVMFYHRSLENIYRLVQESDKRQHFFTKLSPSVQNLSWLILHHHPFSHSPNLRLSALYISKLVHLTRPLAIFH